MKKTFLVKRNALLSSTGVSWGLLACAGAIIVLLLRLIAPNIFWHVFTPVFQGADALALKSHLVSSSFGDVAALTVENEQLANENAALISQNQSLTAKADSLSALLDSSQTKKGIASEILAGVVARPPESPYDTLVLAAGAKTGIAIGMEVFAAGGVPIGVVSSVLPDFSRVTLFSAPEKVVQGWIGHNNLPLAIEGNGAGAMSATIARSAGIVEGDTVFAPGPGALAIGTIGRIDSNPTAPEVMLHITSAVNMFSITWVVVRDTGAALLTPLPVATSTLP